MVGKLEINVEYKEHNDVFEFKSYFLDKGMNSIASSGSNDSIDEVISFLKDEIMKYEKECRRKDEH